MHPVVEKGELIQDIPHLMQTMLEPSFMNRLNENIIPYTTWTYERQEEPVSPLALKSETKKPVIMAFVNCRLEQSPVKLDDPAYKLTIHLQLDDYKKFKQDCQEMIQKHNLPTKSPLSLVELASVITFEVLVTIESRLGPVLTQEMIESTTVKGGIQFDPLKGKHILTFCLFVRLFNCFSFSHFASLHHRNAWQAAPKVGQ